MHAVRHWTRVDSRRATRLATRAFFLILVFEAPAYCKPTIFSYLKLSHTFDRHAIDNTYKPKHPLNQRYGIAHPPARLRQPVTDLTCIVAPWTKRRNVMLA